MPHRAPDVPSEHRISALEKELKQLRLSRWFHALKYGGNALLAAAAVVLLGWGGLTFYEATVQSRTAAAAEELELRHAAEDECTRACANIDMRVMRTLVERKVDDDGRRYVNRQCSCHSASEQRTLWSDYAGAPPSVACELREDNTQLTCTTETMPRRILLMDKNENVHLDFRAGQITLRQ